MPARGLAGRLAAVEQVRDSRRLMHPYRTKDGRTVRVSSLDVLRMVNDGLRMEYDARHDAEPAPAPEPPPVARTVATLDPDNNSMLLDLMWHVATEWCDAYDEHRPFTYDTPEPAPC
jgi:hypothetical protein